MPEAATPFEQVLGAGAGGPLTAPTPWIQEKDATSAYVLYPAGVVIGNPPGGNQGLGALNLQTLYLNGVLVNLANYVLLAGGTMTGILTLSADPVNANDAATKRYVDTKIVGVNSTFANYLPLTGGTMNGSLTMSGSAVINLAADPTTNLQAATKQYVDSRLAGLIGIPDAPSDGTFYGRKSGNWSNIIDIGTY